MNEKLFLKQLRIQLRGLPSEDIDAIINDYESYFFEAKESGLSEEQAAKNLGNPLDIAQNIKVSGHEVSSYPPMNRSQLGSAIIIVVLIFLNVSFVLGPFLGIVGAFFGIFISCIVVMISPLFVLVNMLFNENNLFEFFLSITLSGISIIMLPLLIGLGKEGKQLIIKYVEWNKRIARGEVL